MITTPSPDRICIERHIAHPLVRVFAAHTERKLVRQWMLGPDGWAMPVCDIDLRVGGTYRYEWAREGHGRMGVRGTYLEIEPPTRLVFTERFEEAWYPGECIVTIQFTGRDNCTDLAMTLQYEDETARDTALKVPMAEGMEESYRRLDNLLQKISIEGDGLCA